MPKSKEEKRKSSVKLVKWLAGSQQTWNGWGERETYEDKGVVYDAQTGEALGRSRPKTSSSNKSKKNSPPEEQAELETREDQPEAEPGQARRSGARRPARNPQVNRFLVRDGPAAPASSVDDEFLSAESRDESPRGRQ